MTSVVALKLLSTVVLLGWATVQADVSHLGYRGYRGERLRLQRLESEASPYPAAGFRPNREFNLPHDQPLFPLANQHNSRPGGSNGFNNLGESQRPQLIYGSPEPEPRFRPKNRPQKFNSGANEPQEQFFVVQYEKGYNTFERPQQPQNFNKDVNNGFNNLAASSPQSESDFSGTQNGFNNFAEPQQPQQPEVLYGAPNNQEQDQQNARLKQQLIARLQQAQRLEQIQQQQLEKQRYSLTQQQQQQQSLNSPQTLYSAPEQQFQAESQTSSRFVLQKPARLSVDKREETELETDAKSAESEEIETTTKHEEKKVKPQVANKGVAPPNGVANPSLVSYYPAGAVGFVQPFNGAYIAPANYPTLQPVSPAAYTLGSPFLTQPYALAASPAAPLQAW